MSEQQCQHVFVYVRPLWGYCFNVTCRKCGEVYGSSESPDPDFLAGFNRNSRVLARRKAVGGGARGSRGCTPVSRSVATSSYWSIRARTAPSCRPPTERKRSYAAAACSSRGRG
jgi:hypothetical protein